MFAITHERFVLGQQPIAAPTHSADITLHKDMSEHDIPEFMECKLEKSIACIEIATAL